MICNNSLTVYHKTFDNTTHLEKWIRYNYNNVWVFNGKSGVANKGYDNANNVQIRIPYNKNGNLNINNFAIGDIIVKGTLNYDIETQQDIDNCLVYNITSINNNNFGNNKHIHLGGA